jgi:hypothetical protein
MRKIKVTRVRSDWDSSYGAVVTVTGDVVDQFDVGAQPDQHRVEKFEVNFLLGDDGYTSVSLYGTQVTQKGELHKRANRRLLFYTNAHDELSDADVLTQLGQDKNVTTVLGLYAIKEESHAK